MAPMPVAMPPRAMTRGRNVSTTAVSPRSPFLEGRMCQGTTVVKLCLFTQRRRRVVLGSSYPISCIAPPLTGQNFALSPSQLDRPALHVVALDRYAKILHPE